MNTPSQPATYAMRDQGPAQYSENWFFYWQISPSNWKDKIEDLKTSGPIFIPLFWGNHSDDGELIDFGEIKPENDLQRLLQILAEVGRKAVFLLPLSSVPFLPQGGAPIHLSRHYSQLSSGLTQAFIDSNGNINKMISFHDPRVYQAFRKWCWTLGEYLSQKKIGQEIIGLKCFWINNEGPQNYLYDFSESYFQGYIRFLNQENLLENNHENRDDTPLILTSEEKKHQTRYQNLIEELYVKTAEDSLTHFWGGEVSYGFLGGHPNDIFLRTNDNWDNPEHLMNNLMSFLEWGIIPTGLLLPYKNKRGVVERFFNDYLHPSIIKNLIKNDEIEDDLGPPMPLTFFDLYWSENPKSKGIKLIEDLGLISILRRDYQSCWRIHPKFTAFDDRSENFIDRLGFHFASQLDRPKFTQILKNFMNGHKIVLDRDGLDPVLEKRLQLFITENALEQQLVNFLTPLNLVKLGDGMLLIISGEKLKEHPPVKKFFFGKMFLNI